MSPLGDQESEMPDPELREAMMRSLRETRYDHHETPDMGGASGSGRAVASSYHQRASPLQAGTPNTQSDGEGSLLPNRPPTIATGVEASQPPQPQPRPMTPADQCVILEDRVSREKRRINKLIDKVTAVDQELTEVDMNELNGLKQSVMACQRQIDHIKENPSNRVGCNAQTTGDLIEHCSVCTSTCFTRGE